MSDLFIATYLTHLLSPLVTDATMIKDWRGRKVLDSIQHDGFTYEATIYVPHNDLEYYRLDAGYYSEYHGYRPMVFSRINVDLETMMVTYMDDIGFELRTRTDDNGWYWKRPEGQDYVSAFAKAWKAWTDYTHNHWRNESFPEDSKILTPDEIKAIWDERKKKAIQ